MSILTVVITFTAVASAASATFQDSREDTPRRLFQDGGTILVANFRGAPAAAPADRKPPSADRKPPSADRKPPSADRKLFTTFPVRRASRPQAVHYVTSAAPADRKPPSADRKLFTTFPVRRASRPQAVHYVTSAAPADR